MLHEEKQHGIEMDKIPVETEVIIVPDAGSNQIDELTELNQRGIICLVMDHHQVDSLIDHLENIVIVNNQISKDFNNKALSGAGVVLKIVQLYDKLFFNDTYANTFYDLAALGIIADCMDSRTLDNNFIIRRGFKSFDTNLIYKVENKVLHGYYFNPTLIVPLKRKMF